jgi:hypothetical protein
VILETAVAAAAAVAAAERVVLYMECPKFLIYLI